jgi:ABC-type nickel/cobalt efflux system permease component RcnA
MSFQFLFTPLENADHWLTDQFAGAPLLVAIGVAALLGLRHASDPDHLVAVTSLVASKDGNPRAAAQLGAWWGLGHATMLILVGIPLILLKSGMPTWVESTAEKAVAAVILLLAGKVIWKWVRGDYRIGKHRHDHSGHRHLHDGDHHDHRSQRSPSQAFGIGLLHGLAGTGAVTVLLLAGLHGELEATAALGVFAPISILSMAGFTTGFAWVLTRPVIEPLYRRVLIPVVGTFGVLFGLWYAGIA